MIRVLVADDEALVRGGFKMILEAHQDMEVVGEAVDGGTAIELVAQLHPDVVLMDIRMPGTDGLTATKAILDQRTSAAPVRILILTTFDLDEYVYEAMRAGASGFLLKSSPPDELAEAVRTVAAGDVLLAPAITRKLIESYVAQRPRKEPDFLSLLTGREEEVLRQVARGLSNAEIAGDLFVSEATVKTHVNRLLRKLGLRDRVQAVVLAYESGLVIPTSEQDPA